MAGKRLRVAYVGRCCENALNADADDVQSSGRISTTRCRRSGTDIRGIARLGSTIAGCASAICRTTGAGCAFATCCTTGAGRVVCIWHTSRGGCIQVRNSQKSATLRPQHQSKNSQLNRSHSESRSISEYQLNRFVRFTRRTCLLALLIRDVCTTLRQLRFIRVDVGI